MTKEERADIRARCEAATPGPWKVGDGSEKDFFCGAGCVVSDSRVVVERALYRDIFDDQTYEDIEFIVHAKQDIPALLNKVDDLGALVSDHLAEESFLRQRLRETEADRDRWKARAEEMEAAIKGITDKCAGRFCTDCRLVKYCGVMGL